MPDSNFKVDNEKSRLYYHRTQKIRLKTDGHQSWGVIHIIKSLEKRKPLLNIACYTHRIKFIPDVSSIQYQRKNRDI